MPAVGSSLQCGFRHAEHVGIALSPLDVHATVLAVEVEDVAVPLDIAVAAPPAVAVGVEVEEVAVSPVVAVSARLTASQIVVHSAVAVAVAADASGAPAAAFAAVVGTTAVEAVGELVVDILLDVDEEDHTHSDCMVGIYLFSCCTNIQLTRPSLSFTLQQTTNNKNKLSTSSKAQVSIQLVSRLFSWSREPFPCSFIFDPAALNMRQTLHKTRSTLHRTSTDTLDHRYSPQAP
eukprot:GHVS01051632.1.p2 GENE.GHVS01051632.1~~GHVS01051632.1.p2  ORF type:complete len:234 (-),score=40.91 GHVS01051632.1:524-1225(-)